MTKQIFKAILFSVLLMLLLSASLILSSFYHTYDSAVSESLQSQLQFIEKSITTEGLSFFDGLEKNNTRLTWINKDGVVLADTFADASSMDNHSDREEFIMAQMAGYGKSVRYSSTLAEKTIYTAKRIQDGSVIRLASTEKSILLFFIQALELVALALILVAIIAIFIAKALSAAIVRPINTLNLDDPLSNDTYDEISPLLSRIARQNREIQSQLGLMRQQRKEFTLITDNMEEGLILLDEDQDILSINKSAQRIFDITKDCEGINILQLSRSLPLQEMLQEVQKGKHGETKIEKEGCTYQLDASPINKDGVLSGIAILLQDISEKAAAESLRQSFSANVSHELKTPLQTISGAAELLSNDLVKENDKKTFYEKIQAESTRLLTLINDIIQISQLDESQPMVKEAVDLSAISKATIHALEDKAAKLGVTVSFEGESAPILGVRHLLEEIVFNLTDNAITYNHKGGTVALSITKHEDQTVLKVRDTGIGIPKESQSRIFERFYRVDKSHSKETGGTGLGLSIVKHAAEYHHAAITLESALGKSTVITIIFPPSTDGR